MEEQKQQRGSSRNRVAGHRYERSKAQQLRDIGYTDVRTSRECSRKRDSQKVDLCNADEDEFGRLPYNIQCKTLCSTAPYPRLLKELEQHNGRKQINVVFHEMTKKKEGGKNFVSVGEYAILNLDDFIKMVQDINRYRAGFDEAMTYFDSISDEEQPKLLKYLKKLGL